MLDYSWKLASGRAHKVLRGLSARSVAAAKLLERTYFDVMLLSEVVSLEKRKPEVGVGTST
jgi:hypothetical protein